MTRGKRSTARTAAPARTQAGTDLQAPIRSAQETLENSFADHNARHENGGADELNLAGLSGELADPQPPKAHKTSHENGGGDEINVAGLSGVLADPQTPADHAAEHAAAGGDPIDVTTLDGYPGGGTTFLRDDGAFAAPVTGASGTFTSQDGKTITVVDGVITAIV